MISCILAGRRCCKFFSSLTSYFESSFYTIAYLNVNVIHMGEINKKSEIWLFLSNSNPEIKGIVLVICSSFSCQINNIFLRIIMLLSCSISKLTYRITYMLYRIHKCTLQLNVKIGNKWKKQIWLVKNHLWPENFSFYRSQLLVDFQDSFRGLD